MKSSCSANPLHCGLLLLLLLPLLLPCPSCRYPHTYVIDGELFLQRAYVCDHVQAVAGRRGSCFLSTNRLNSNAEGILKSALFPSQSGDSHSGDSKAQNKARKHSSVRAATAHVPLVASSHGAIHTSYQQTGHRSSSSSGSRGSRSSGSGSGLTGSQTHADSSAEGREKMSPPNFKVTSASLQINDHLIATDHEFVLNDEDSEKLNEHAGQVTPTTHSLTRSI